MAEWNSPLPDEAEVGNPNHVQDHNQIVAALHEVRSNVDDIELTEGPRGQRGPAGADGADGQDGSDAENPFTADEVAALKALVADD